MDIVPYEIFSLGATALVSVMTLVAAGASSIKKPESAVRRMEEPQRADAISGCDSWSATPHTFSS
jgi:hypothetical protein